MNNELHLLSESAVWITESEFTDLAKNRSAGNGESHIKVDGQRLTNTSWVEMADGSRISNTYSIEKIQDNLYRYNSSSPALGIQASTFITDKSCVYSKFAVKNTRLNGFEVIIRNGNTRHAHGALYNGDELINTWVATMRKTE
ncbi:MAG: hypothetical protein LBG19_08745 [Prevotellaceae bacterium]|jgi:hypothetical protein|nr:hypothetical protein [Prevotellaceae bacterium]